MAEIGETAEAVTRHQAAIDVLSRLVQDYPITPGYRQELANSYNSIGVVLLGSDRAGTHAAWIKAVDQFRVLVERTPDNPGFRGDLGMTLGNLGRLSLLNGRVADARDAIREALPELQGALRSTPDHPAYRPSAENAVQDLAKSLVKLRETEEAGRQFTSLLTSDDRFGIRLAALFLKAALTEIDSDGAAPDTPITGTEEFKRACRQGLLDWQNSPERREWIATDPLLKDLKVFSESPQTPKSATESD